MKLWMTTSLLLVVLGSLEGSTLAQTARLPEHGTAIDAGAANSARYYNLTNSFDPWGVAGISPGYLGAGLSGYGPGSILNNQSQPWPVAQKTLPGQPNRASTPAIAPKSPKIKNDPRKLATTKSVPKAPVRKAP